MAFKWILFDIDNTLLDFSKASKHSFYQTLESYGIQCDTTIHNIYRKINAEVWEDFESKKITALELRSLRFERFFQAMDFRPCSPEVFGQQYLSNLVKVSESYPGVIPMLDNLKGNYRLSIITNGLEEVQRPRLNKLGMEKYFDSIIVSDEIGVAKPETAFFNHTYNSISNPPPKEEILVVGDSLNSDILGGNNFGVKTCWINPENKNTDKVLPDFQIKRAVDLPELILGY